MKKYTVLKYFYRDASNYKSETLIHVTGEIDDTIRTRIQKACVRGDEFVPEAIGLPLIRPSDAYEPQDDHPWACFQQFADNCSPVNWSYKSTITVDDLLKRFEDAAGKWEELAAIQTEIDIGERTEPIVPLAIEHLDFKYACAQCERYEKYERYEYEKYARYENGGAEN